MRHETAIFGPQKSQIQKFQLSFFVLFFSFNNQEHKNVLKPLVLLCFSKVKKNKNSNQNTETWKTQFLHPFFVKKMVIYKKLHHNWQKTQNDNWVCKKSPETTIKN